MREATEKQAGSEAPVESPVDSKLQRIEELSQQIARQDGRLDSFWQQLTERLSAAEVEVWSDDLLDCGAELLFDSARAGSPGDSSGERGLQLGFCPEATGKAGAVRGRAATMGHGSTLYSSLEKPEPAGEPRPLAQESRAVRLAALRQLPELLDGLLGSLNDTLAVVQTALGDPVETSALVSSPFSHRGQQSQAAVIKIGSDEGPGSEGA